MEYTLVSILISTHCTIGINIQAAGDSAQCISNDSAFRYANVQALFFDHYAQTEYESSAKPKLCTLSLNMRSMQGILKFSSLIMSLLWKGMDLAF